MRAGPRGADAFADGIPDVDTAGPEPLAFFAATWTNTVTPFSRLEMVTEVPTEVPAESTVVHVVPVVLYRTSYPVTCSDTGDAFHVTVSERSCGATASDATAVGNDTGEVFRCGVVTGVTVGVMGVPEAAAGVLLFLVLLLVPGATLLFDAAARAFVDAANGSAVETAMEKATTTRPSRAPSFFRLVMIGVSTTLRTEALRMAMPGSFVFTIRPP